MSMYPNIKETGYVQTQPTTTTTTVILNQPVAPREWNHKLCGCFDDCGECCFAYFCTCCYMYRLTQRINESCWAMCYGGLVPMRTKLRTERKINGSIVEDYFTVACCPFCSLVQMSKEARDTNPLI